MKDIPGFPNYQITKDGRVWSKPRKSLQKHKIGGQWIKPAICSSGYLGVSLCVNSKAHTRSVHQLVLETYIGPCPEGMQCRHLDGNPINNNLDNLCWGTPKENQHDRLLHGTDNQGEKHGVSKLTDDKVRVIRYLRDVAKFTLKDIAWQFDIAMTTVYDICKRRSWKHI